MLFKGLFDSYSIDENTTIHIPNKHGKNSSIFIGTKSLDNSRVIIKRVAIPKNFDIQQFLETCFTIQSYNTQIVQTIDVSCDSLYMYIIRQYIEGISLKQLIYDKEFSHVYSHTIIYQIFIQLCDILNDIHTQGVIHRDIKPSNIIIQFDSKNSYVTSVHLVDIEMALFNGNEVIPHEKPPFALIYSSPEQVLRKANLTNHTSDIFSLGISLYESLVRKTPFTHTNPELLLHMQLSIIVPKHHVLPHSIYNIITKACSIPQVTKPLFTYKPQEQETLLIQSQQNRYSSVLELQKDLDQYIRQKGFENSKQSVLKFLKFFK